VRTGGCAEAALAVLLVIGEVPLVPHPGAAACAGEDVGADAVEEPAVVATQRQALSVDRVFGWNAGLCFPCDFGCTFPEIQQEVVEINPVNFQENPLMVKRGT